MTIIIPANSAADTAYSVDNSCRFNDADNAHLVRTPGASGTEEKWTLSFWFKRGSNIGTQTIMFSANPTTGHDMQISLFGGNDFDFSAYNGGVYQGKLRTNRLFRDPSAWYHAVCVWDTGNATAGNRMRLYINGVEETSFSTDTQPAEDEDDSVWNETNAQYIGVYGNGTYGDFDGYLAEVIFCDGQALTPSSFGEFDEDSPTIWKPKDPSGVTFGTQGFWIDFEDSSDLGKDVSGNGNDYTSANLAAADQATDTPTNNFCTMNPLDNYIAAATFSEGNCNLVHPSSSNNAFCTSTFWLSSGKWYAEAKVSTSAGSDNNLIGISSVTSPSADNAGSLGQTTSNYSYLGDGGGYRYNNSTTAYGSAYGVNAVIGVYLDLDNNKLYFAEDGTIQASGTGITITAAALQPSGLYTMSGGDWSSSTGTQWSWNFGGCPSFAISSGNADANGYGNFEYSPNDGGGSSFDSAAKDFLAICTKNLGSDGG